MKQNRTYFAMAAVLSLGMLAACSDSNESEAPAAGGAPAVESPAPSSSTPEPTPAPEAAPEQSSSDTSSATESMKQSGEQLKEDAKAAGSAVADKAGELTDAAGGKMSDMGDA